MYIAPLRGARIGKSSWRDTAASDGVWSSEHHRHTAALDQRFASSDWQKWSSELDNELGSLSIWMGNTSRLDKFSTTHERCFSALHALSLRLLLQLFVVRRQLVPLGQLPHHVEEPLAHPPREVFELVLSAFGDLATFACVEGYFYMTFAKHWLGTEE